MKKITKFFAATLLSLSFVLPLAACGGHTHVDSNNDGFCDSCEEPMTQGEVGGHTHVDSNNDGFCDKCQEPMGSGPSTLPPVGDTDLLEEDIIDDCYDTYYQIFPSAFCDTNGDNYGDLDGITSKLEYIRDLGYTGIWLTPINESDSYHGYNVIDYKSIHHQLGTMEDFDELIEKAHSLGIKVIIDLVINHSSENHPWFKYALEDAAYGFGTYLEYYNYSSTSRSDYVDYGGKRYFEAHFGKNMPDLNLDCPALQNEIKDIVEFWIKDEKVDGFRLDAALHFFAGQQEKSAKFTKKLKDWADAAIKESRNDPNAEAFIVGEVWDNSNTIQTFYKNAGGANFFDFSAGGPGGSIVNSARLSTINNQASAAMTTFFNSMNGSITMSSGYIPCPFLDNHDVDRISSALLKNATSVKFAYGLLSLFTGNSFSYYGDEIGVAGSIAGRGDCDVRVGMRWSADTPFFAPGGTSTPDVNYFYPFGSVEEQLADKNSIINYYKLCNNARNAFPALMRGTPSRGSSSNSNVLVMTKTYQGKSVTVVVNFSASQQTVTGLSDTLKLKQGICVSGSVSGTASSLNVPGFGIAILA